MFHSTRSRLWCSRRLGRFLLPPSFDLRPPGTTSRLPPSQSRASSFIALTSFGRDGLRLSISVEVPLIVEELGSTLFAAERRTFFSSLFTDAIAVPAVALEATDPIIIQDGSGNRCCSSSSVLGSRFISFFFVEDDYSRPVRLLLWFSSLHLAHQPSAR